MELLSVIRRWRLREGVSIREISRRTKLSRNTIKRYLRDGTLEPKYPARQGQGKLDGFVPTLEAWLAREASRSRKQRRNLRRLYADLVALGYRGSYDRVAAHARGWRRRVQEASRGTFVPLRFAPGEAFQFDWSEDWAVLGGERCKVNVAQFKLSHSRAFLLQAYPLQTHEMLFDAHNRAFVYLGGVPKRGIYDNMKTAVDRLARGRERVVNTRFTALVSHYLFEAEFCNPAAGWEKGQIEKNVQDARHRLWHDVPAVANFEELNAWLAERCRALWEDIRHPEMSERTVMDVWREEQPHLMAVPGLFDGFVEQTKRVSPTCLVALQRNRYSVPASFANQPVSLRVYAGRVVVVAEGQVIAEHPRQFTRSHDGPGKTVYDWRHYLAVLQRKPGALRNGAPFTTLPEPFRRLQSVLRKHPGGDREMVDILALVLHHDEQAVLCAVELALEAKTPSKQHILNLLARLVESPVPRPVTSPPGLMLGIEPQANVTRYDSLRESDHAA